MNKHEFLDHLATELAAVPDDERRAALEFYAESIDELVEDGLTESQAVGVLEPPEAVAQAVVAQGLPSPEAAARIRAQVERDAIARQNALQKKIALFTLLATAVLLLGILAHSIMYFAMNQLYPVDPLPADFSGIGEHRQAIRTLADNLLYGVSGIAHLTCFVLVVLYAKFARPITWHRVAAYGLVTLAAALLFTLPFAALDPQFAGDYLAVTLLTALPAWVLAFLLFMAVNCAKTRSVLKPGAQLPRAHRSRGHGRPCAH